MQVFQRSKIGPWLHSQHAFLKSFLELPWATLNNFQCLCCTVFSLRFCNFHLFSLQCCYHPTNLAGINSSKRKPYPILPRSHPNWVRFTLLSSHSSLYNLFSSHIVHYLRTKIIFCYLFIIYYYLYFYCLAQCVTHERRSIYVGKMVIKYP